MTRIYINWETEEVFTSLKEVINSISYYDKDISFCFYLDENYTPDTVYGMTDEQVEKVKQEYNTWVENEVKEYIRNTNWTVLEVDADSKVKFIQ